MRPLLTVLVTPHVMHRLQLAGSIVPRIEAELGFRVLGHVIKRNVGVGDIVTKGQVIAMLDPLVLELSVRSAEADLSHAEAQLRNASLAERRQFQLSQVNSASQADYESALLAKESADASLATQVRDDIYLINVIGRAQNSERGSIETLKNLQLPMINGTSVPLSAVVRFSDELEQPKIWRRARLPTITVEAGVVNNLQPATIVAQLEQQMSDFKKALPPGYTMEVGGAVEESAKAQGPIAAVAPMMLFVMMTILMVQLQSFSRLALVFSVAPLALIGVVIALLLSNSPMGFVAILGVLALIGILIRNTVILIVQIEKLRQEGVEAWRAVVEATENRMRPIMLTAAAATMALIPISREVFWGPMAFAMMGGIIVGTVLTLLFLPALYVVWFRIKRPISNDEFSR
jgi:multidrug efflux pump subunit AcrB